MADIVAAKLRDMILLGDLEPGRRTTQDELAKMLNVSTMPVREALLKLSAQGLIEAAKHRSFRVVVTTKKDIEDTYWQHAALAGEITRRAALNTSEVLVKTLRETEEAYESAVATDEFAAMTSANWQFHRSINIAADSPRLQFMLKVTLGFIPDGLYSEIPDWGPRSIGAHRLIISAISAGYADTAAGAASEHVLEAGERLVSRLSERGFWKNAC